MYPAAAYNSTLGTDGTLGIVWSDKRNCVCEGANYDHLAEIYAATFNVRGKIASTNSRLTETVLDEWWPAVAETSTGFVAAMHRAHDGIITTRGFNALGQPQGVLQNATPTPATRPVALSWNGVDRLGMAWRDLRIGLEDPRIMFKLLDSSGAPIGSMEDGIIVGNGVRYIEEPGPYPGAIGLSWDESHQIFTIVWDMVPGDPYGHPEEAEVFITRISSDAVSVDSPRQLSNDANGSIMPSVAMQAVALIAWHDNRNEVDGGLFAGDIYTSTLTCH